MVLDASAAVEWLLGRPGAAAVTDRLRAVDAVHVPHLLAVEVTQVLRRGVYRGELGNDRARQALDDLVDLDAHRHDHEPLLPIVWHLRTNLTAYDAVYVALATVLDAPLVTADAALARSPGNDAVIDLIE